MSENGSRTELQGLYGALLGGMMSSFIGMAVFWGVAEREGAVGANAALIAMVVGLTFATAFMAAGLYVSERMRWLSSALLFAAGFTTLWSLSISFAAEQRWAILVGLGVAITTGITLGWRRFGRGQGEGAPSGDEAVWTP